MADHMQQGLPSHLKKYRGGNTFIPEHARNEITEHLENSVPDHMKEYTGAYMQQNVIEPSVARRSTTPGPVEAVAAPETPQAPQAAVMQPSVSVQPTVSAPAPGPAPAAPPSPSPDQPYDFITNPAAVPKEPFLSRLPGGNSMISRIGLIAGVLLVVIIIFVVMRGLLSSTPNLTSLITVAQQQQELIHLVSEGSQQQGLPIEDQNLAATMQASLGSSQTTIIQYLATNHKKVNAKQLNLKVSAAVDNQLAAAASAGTFNSTYREVLQNQLNVYGNTLTAAYKQDHGPKGRALLDDNYRQLQLFQAQLKPSTD